MAFRLSSSLVVRSVGAAVAALCVAALALTVYLWSSRDDYAYERAMGASLSGVTVPTIGKASPSFDPTHVAAAGKVGLACLERVAVPLGTVPLQLNVPPTTTTERPRPRSRLERTEPPEDAALNSLVVPVPSREARDRGRHWCFGRRRECGGRATGLAAALWWRVSLLSSAHD